jgi:hypothetical protein
VRLRKAAHRCGYSEDARTLRWLAASWQPTLLDHDTATFDGLGGDDDAAAPPIRDVDVYGRGASGPRRDAAGELGEV